MDTANKMTQEATNNIEIDAAISAASSTELLESPEDILARELQESQAQVADLKDQLLRNVAEGENIRRRARLDVEEKGKYAVTGFARDLVSVAENLQRAVDSIPAEESSNDALKNLKIGVEMTLQELLSVMEKHGIKRIHPQGEAFDHNFHQAVVQIDNESQINGTILQVLQAGYVIHDRLLRPAMVGVAKSSQNQVDTKA